MQIVLLGTAAGGGFPQWNCWCDACRVARRDPAAAHPRRQSSVAVSADGATWFLLNASPDVREQLALLPSRGEPSSIRHVPIEGILLTDAEIDHSLGVVLLREAGTLSIAATAAVRAIVEDDSRFLSLARAFAEMPATDLPLDRAVTLRDRCGHATALTVEAFAVPAGPPRFAPSAAHGHTVGLAIRDRDSATMCAFVPGCGELTAPLVDRLSRADVLLFDGTFWTDDELVRQGISSCTARDMDHVPISGDGGSLRTLAHLPCRHRVYTHINNTNPILLERSAERRAVEDAGLAVGEDGMRFVV